MTVPIVPGPDERPTSPPPPQPVYIVKQAANATNTLSTMILVVLGICCGVPIIGTLAVVVLGGIGSAISP